MIGLPLFKRFWLPLSILLVVKETGTVEWPLLIPTSAAADLQSFEIGSEQFLAIAQLKNGSDYSINSKVYRWEKGTFVEYHPVATTGACALDVFLIGVETFLAVANTFDGKSGNIDSKLYKWDSCFLNEYQSIPTRSASGMTSFTIGMDNFLAVANSQDTSKGSSSTKSKIYKQEEGEFIHQLKIPTSNAYDLEFFKIGSASFLAVANTFDGVSNRVDSKVYSLEGNDMTEVQGLASTHAIDIEAFSIGSESFLAIANYYAENETVVLAGGGHTVNSTIYKWDGTAFKEFQHMVTSGASDIEFFVMGSHSYLAIANAYNDTASIIDSVLYKWVAGSFEVFQTIPTNGARDFEYFTIGSDSFLGVANWPEGITEANSKILKWDGSHFVTFQEIPTSGAIDLESFSVDGSIFLAVANLRKGQDHSIDSKVYKWNSTSTVFEEFQSIPTIGASDFKYFKVGNYNFLAVSNAYDGGSFQLNSVVYRLENGAFKEYQRIPTSGAQDIEFFVFGHEQFLAIANAYGQTSSDVNINTVMYRWKGGIFKELQNVETYGAKDFEFFTVGMDNFLAVGNSFYAQVFKWTGSEFGYFQDFLGTLLIPDIEAFSIGSDNFLALAYHYNSTGNVTYNVNSPVYKWNGTAFAHFQYIATVGAEAFKFFKVQSHNILAVANAYNGVSNQIDSVLYKWDGTMFTMFQRLATNGARDFDFFTIGSDNYLAVANWPNEDTSANSMVYMWNGTFFADVPHTFAADADSLQPNICTTTTTTISTTVTVEPSDGDSVQPEVELTTAAPTKVPATTQGTLNEVNGARRLRASCLCLYLALGVSGFSSR